MKRISIIIIILATAILSISAQNDDYRKETKARAQMNKIIELIRHDDINQLASYIEFPIERPDPIPNIESKESFILYYHTLFDSTVKRIVFDTMQIFSDMLVDKYTYNVGFHRGDFYLNENGIITSINFTSLSERDLQNSLNNEAFSLMDPSIKRCKEPLLVLKSERYILRIDLMDDNSARYISWSTPKKISDKPDLILQNGTFETQGNMGSITYTFKNGDWKYIVDYVAICSQNECGYFLRLLHHDVEKESIRLEKVKNNGL